MTYNFYFESAKNVTNPGDDNIALAFEFSYVPADKIGLPEQKTYLKEHRLIVTIANSRLASWKLSSADLTKVLFEIGRRYLKQELESGIAWDEYTIRMLPWVTTANFPAECPYDPALIPEVEGFSEAIEVQKKIGFR